MKNSIHNYYSGRHGNDPEISFDECMGASHLTFRRRAKIITTAALAATVLLGMVLVPLFQQHALDGSTEPSMESNFRDGSFAAAQRADSTGETEQGDAAVRNPPTRESLGGDNTEILPVTTIAPAYPSEALEAEITGWVLMSFTVTSEGEVADAVVADAEPAEIFNESALAAIRQFQFNPRVVEGEAVAVEEVKYLFRFNL